MHEIIPGRAATLTLKWNNDTKLCLLNVYAPNDPSDSGTFWTEIVSVLETRHLPRPDVLLGDFDTVEDSIDRLPNRMDNFTTVSALRALRTNLNLVDG